ncbi:hypothetical protein [Methanothermococcus sp.]|uniref:hypothetical protein n=1 Tax=Methanothermococcus sp. TaxID=2614238 RepID=UPI0025DD2A6B|nr:hypothetical protein [Methanothermococcus sp.]
MKKLTESQINELKISFLLSTAICSIIISIDILVLIYLVNTVEILRVILYSSSIGFLIGYLTFKILKMDLFTYHKNNKKLLAYMGVWFISSMFVSIIFHYIIGLKYHLKYPDDLIVCLALVTMVFIWYFIGSFLLNIIGKLVKPNVN